MGVMKFVMVIMSGLLLAASVPLSGCNLAEQRYGVRKIESPGGRVLYFRRTVRGLNFDKLVLTPNKDHCSVINPETDIVFRGLGPILVFYRFDSETLKIYLTSAVEVPKGFNEFIAVEQNVISNAEFIRLTDEHKQELLEVSNIELNPALQCTDNRYFGYADSTV